MYSFLVDFQKISHESCKLVNFIELVTFPKLNQGLDLAALEHGLPLLSEMH